MPVVQKSVPLPAADQGPDLTDIAEYRELMARALDDLIQADRDLSRLILLVSRTRMAPPPPAGRNGAGALPEAGQN